ncbi:MAG: protein phosphatase 2C domain-containing protein [Clostridia bacterium]|nr:protein phosphatase 2C domain-containing protein [Clostridia bacterium]
MSTWLYNYGEQVGRSHLVTDPPIPCQDKALCVEENGVFVAAVSDGCGSADLSQYGSNATVRALCKVFTERFDELLAYEQLDLRKAIVNAIAEGIKNIPNEIPEIYEQYKQEHKEEYKKASSDQSFLFHTAHATALFVAVKNEDCIIGQIGDGVIGVIIDNKLKISIEENKSGEVNGTFYPDSIYSLGQNDERWYRHPAYQITKAKTTNISGFILTTDGVTGILDARIPFQKRYIPYVDKNIFRKLVDLGFEEANKHLYEVVLPGLVKTSISRDDCGIAILVKDDYKIEEYVIKEYPRPTEEELDEIYTPKQEQQTSSEKKDIEVEAPQNVEQEPEEEIVEEPEENLEEKTRTLEELAEKLSRYIDVKALFEKLEIKHIELLELYLNVLQELEAKGFYEIKDLEKQEQLIAIILELDDSLELDEEDKKIIKK